MTKKKGSSPCFQEDSNALKYVLFGYQYDFKFKYATKGLSPYNALKPSQVDKPISYTAEGEFTQITRKAGQGICLFFLLSLLLFWNNDLRTKHLEKIVHHK
jgi:hypothetical protein